MSTRAGLPGLGANTGEVRSTRTTQGRFVWLGDEVRLVSDRGEDWGPGWYTIVSGGWGWGDDGVARLPRPWLYTETGQVTIRGDIVLIEHLDGHPDRAIARPAPCNPSRDAWLAATFADGGAERVRSQLVPRDVRTGEPHGKIRDRQEAEGGQVVREMSILDMDDTLRSLLRLDGEALLEGSKVRLRSVGGSTERLVRGETYLSEANAAWIQAAPLLVAAGSFFGLPTDGIVKFAAKLAVAASGSGPLLTTTVEAE